MARPRYPAEKRPLPPPLPPAERTVGQVVAEAVRLYGRRFWRSLALGVPVAVVNYVSLRVDDAGTRLIVLAPLAPPLLAAAYVGGCVLAAESRPRRDRLLPAFVAGIAVFLPFPVLVSVYILPGLVWFALLGLAVPAILLEGRSLGDGFRRAVELGRADFVHALGALAALVIVLFLTQAALYAALSAQGEQTAEVAGFLAGAVVSPLLFLGAAILYFDQAARVRSPEPTEEERCRPT